MKKVPRQQKQYLAHKVYRALNSTYCPEIVFCIYNQLLPILILKCVDIMLLVKNGIERSSNLSQKLKYTIRQYY